MRPCNYHNYHLSTALWCFGIMSFPFYVLSKGNIQISTVILLVASLQALRGNPARILLSGPQGLKVLSIPLVLFVLYVAIIQLAWAILLSEEEMLVFILFYTFNLIIFAAVSIRSWEDERFQDLLVKSTLASVYLQVALSAFGFGWSPESSRGTIYFQNPNQLGYFSILCASILTVGVKRKLIGGLWFGSGLLGCLWLAQVSLSKSAMLSIVLLLLFGGMQRASTVVMVGSVLMSIIVWGFFEDRVEQVTLRFMTLGNDDDDNLAGRGYDRIWMHPEMLILGGGEGAVWRWESFLATGEIHSSWGTVLFSYGIPGTLLMLTFLGRLSFRLGLVSLVPMLAITAYGVTHMGLRFVPLWVLFGLIAGVSARGSANRGKITSPGGRCVNCNTVRVSLNSRCVR
jgi:hypothetical protein